MFEILLKANDYYLVSITMNFRGATGAARAPKPGKTPIMAARRRCRHRFLFFKIEVRPRSCRSYHIWRPWALNQDGAKSSLMMGSSCKRQWHIWNWFETTTFSSNFFAAVAHVRTSFVSILCGVTFREVNFAEWLLNCQLKWDMRSKLMLLGLIMKFFTT